MLTPNSVKCVKSLCAQLSGPMLLHEIHFLRRSFRRSPVFHFALQCPQLTVRETAPDVPAAAPRKSSSPPVPGSCSTALGSSAKHLRTNPFVSASGVPLSSRSAAAAARRYFRAVLTSMPAFDAAISCVFSVFDNLNNLLICWSVTIP